MLRQQARGPARQLEGREGADGQRRMQEEEAEAEEDGQAIAVTATRALDSTAEKARSGNTIVDRKANATSRTLKSSRKSSSVHLSSLEFSLLH